MPKKNEGTTIERDIYYVVDVSTALNFADLFDPHSDLPERHLIIRDFVIRGPSRNFMTKTTKRAKQHANFQSSFEPSLKRARSQKKQRLQGIHPWRKASRHLRQ